MWRPTRRLWPTADSWPSDKKKKKKRLRASCCYLTPSWFASSPGTGSRTRTGAWSGCRTRPGVGGGVCASYFFLLELSRGRRVDGFSWGRGPGVRSWSPARLFPGPVSVSEDGQRHRSKTKTVFKAAVKPDPDSVPVILTAPAPPSSIHSTTRPEEKKKGYKQAVVKVTYIS